MNTAIRPEDMERYLQEMRAFAKRAGYTVSPAAPVAPPAAEEPPAPPLVEEEAPPEPDTAPRYPQAPLEQERAIDESEGQESPAQEEGEPPCVPCAAAGEDDGL